MRQLLIVACLLLASGLLPSFAANMDAPQAEFELTNGAGNNVTHLDYRGRFVMYAFGFTNCAHVCPMMMANMAAALRIVERDTIGVFVSVDTERDSPAVAEDYASSFGANMVGLGGSYQQIAEAANNFNITYVVTKSQSNYTVQHTSSIFVVDPEGRIKEVFALNAKPNDIAAAINSVPVEGVK